MPQAKAGQPYRPGPYVMLVFIFFIVGFLTTINGQFQGPLQAAFLSRAELLRNTLTTLISFFFFLGYLLSSGIASRWINRLGYKASLARALMVMVLGLLTYALSALVGHLWPDFSICLGPDRVACAYFIFLAGCFFMGTAAAMTQVVINPYVASYELARTTPVQRMNIACGVNSVGTTIGPFFVSAVIFGGQAVSQVRPGQLLGPILWIALIVLASALLTMRLPLPDLAGTRSSGELPRSVWSFSHLALGVASIFLYVGAEVSIGVNINMHALQMIADGEPTTFFGSDSLTIRGIDLGIPALLATLYWGGMMLGRLLATGFPALSPRWLLSRATTGAAALTLLAMLLDNLYVLAAVGLFHSVMWGCIFTLAVAGLGSYTSRASGVFMAGVFGGAVFPLLQGMLADAWGSWRWTWVIVIGCELAMLVYARWGCRVRDPEALANLPPVPDDPV